MGAVSVKSLYQANIYADGNSLLGKAEEITLPGVKGKYRDVKVLGLLFDLELPSGFEKMNGKLKWLSLDPDVVAQCGSIFQSVQLQVRSSLEGWDSSGRSSEVSVAAFMTVRFKDALPSLDIKPGENPDQESEYSCTYYRLEINGIPVIEVDVINNIYFLNGVDQNATYRNNLGI